MSVETKVDLTPAASPAARAARSVDVMFVIHQIGSSADGGVQSITEQEKEQLFDEFVRWYNNQR